MTSRSHRRSSVAALAFCVASVLVGFFLGESYIDRLPRHAGYFLVGVDDAVSVPIPVRPRHTAFIVVDGLRRDAAETMNVTRELARAGQCRVSDQGSLTVSRPEYALLSTGLEVDRTGSRNNDLTTPLAAESIWEVARQSGLRVSGSSHLPWFAQLFPGGFDRFTHLLDHAGNVFAAENGELLDVNVFHPLYVDEKGHHHGAASPEYAAAVARVDGEIAGLLARMDLAQDLVVLTADHGHRDAGGHGGAQPEIAKVLVCFAGLGVAHRTDRAAFDGRSTAPALAVLLGLRFPRNMRAGDDGLDVLWEIAREDDARGAYIAGRKAAVQHFRDENRIALEGWLGGAPGTWPRLYAREARAQDLRLLALTLLVAACVVASFRARRMTLRASLLTTAWLAFTALAVWSVHHAVLGDFDFTVINLRERFVPRAAAVAVGAVLVSLAAHVWLVRDPPRLAGDLLLGVALLVAANAGHVLVYGWPLGFPLPSQAARYFPFFGAIWLVVQAIAAAIAVVLGYRGSVRLAPLVLLLTCSCGVTMAACSGTAVGTGSASHDDAGPSTPDSSASDAAATPSDASSTSDATTVVDAGPDGTAGPVHLVFVTTAKVDGAFAGASSPWSAADAICASEAMANSLTGSFVAWVSYTDGVGTAFNAGTRISDVPYYLPGTVADGGAPVLIAQSKAELLTSGPRVPLDRVATGARVDQDENSDVTWTWTGTGATGMAVSQTCNAWKSASNGQSGTAGNARRLSSFTAGDWTDLGGRTCDVKRRFYCFQK